MRRLRLALACGALLLAGCGGGEPAAAPDVLRYGVIGDSYSNGEGIGLERSWPTQLAQRLDLEVVVNAAVSGWTTELALAEELPALERARPAVATLQIGANDWVQGVPAATFRARFRKLLAGMVRIVGGPQRVVAVTIPDFSVKPAGAAFARGRAAVGVRAFNAIVRAESAAQDVAVADVFAVSRTWPAAAPDGLHPAEPELTAWTDAIEPVARRAWAPLR